jgi:hypothetical protein
VKKKHNYKVENGTKYSVPPMFVGNFESEFAHLSSPESLLKTDIVSHSPFSVEMETKTNKFFSLFLSS